MFSAFIYRLIFFYFNNLFQKLVAYLRKFVTKLLQKSYINGLVKMFEKIV